MKVITYVTAQYDNLDYLRSYLWVFYISMLFTFAFHKIQAWKNYSLPANTKSEMVSKCCELTQIHLVMIALHITLACTTFLGPWVTFIYYL